MSHVIIQPRTETINEAVAEFRGVEVCAETTVTVTNSSQYFHWKGYGLTLHIPDGCLPADVDQCVINIKASLAGQYKFPEGSHLVSAVYWLRCEPSCKFTKAISVEIEHCAPLENSSKLSIVRSHCTQKQLPYTFKKIGGLFTKHDSRGYIELDSFSGLAATQDGSEEREYCAGLYYLEKTQLIIDIYFVVTWNDETHLTDVSKHYRAKGAVQGPDLAVSFESTDAISLDIPPEGVTTNGGWKIEPLTPVIVTRKLVDSFKPRRRIPCCYMQAVLSRDSSTLDRDPVPVLSHKVVLQGARQPYNTIKINFIPSSNRTTHVPRITQELSDTKPRLSLLLKELWSIASEWKNIGAFVDIDSGDLDAIERQNTTSQHACLREMLSSWLRRASPPPTWSEIIDVVELIGNQAIAQELRTKYQC